jgi:hypothetical protein
MRKAARLTRRPPCRALTLSPIVNCPEESERMKMVDAALGVPAGAIAYSIALWITMSAAPRYAEGVRSCVDLPWRVYAAAPTVAALVLSYSLVYLFVRPVRVRIAFLIVTGLTLVLCTAFGVALLSRDYIGKS